MIFGVRAIDVEPVRIREDARIATGGANHDVDRRTLRDQCAAHVRVLRGDDRHHIVEAAFKALGMALRDALVDSGTVFSTKGAVRW